jgi:hypothetical protein
MNADEIALVTKTIVRLVDAHEGSQLTRGLDDFGWAEVLASRPDVAIAAVFSAQGRSGKWSAALHDVLGRSLHDLGLRTEGQACVVLPRPRSSAPGYGGPDDFLVHGLLLGPRVRATSYVVPVAENDRIRAVVAVPSGALAITRRCGLDPELDAGEISGVIRGAKVVAEGPAAASWWRAAEATARLALTHATVGGLQSMLELARSHATERSQFGRLIGTFQAIRHKLAEAHVAIVAADAAATAAWEADDLPLAAAVAKLVASKAVKVVATHTQQILAGIGFTAEHRYHRFMKRVVVLDRVLGSADDLAPLIGKDLMGRSALPRLVEL